MSNYLENKRVIVTGGAGFLGSFVCEELKTKNVKEIIVPRSSRYNLVEKEAVCDLYLDTMRGGKPVDVVIHLAAEVGGIGANLKHQAEYFYSNLMMGTNLIHEAFKCGISKFVATGTICAYPKHTPIPFKEEDIWSGYPEESNAPYGLAKKMMLVQSQVYRSQYGFNSIYLLPVNLYGPRDNFDLETSHVIPALIRKCVEAKNSKAKSISVWGDGSATREFLYVKDAAKGLVKATELYNDSAPVNLGSSEEISIKNLITLIANLTDFNGEIEWDVSKPNGQPRRKLDVSRAKDLFNFESDTDFEAGLKETIKWYEDSLNETNIVENNRLDASDLRNIAKNYNDLSDVTSVYRELR